MELIPSRSIRSWKTANGGKVPGTVSTICPHCGERGLFALDAMYHDQPRATVCATASCPGCAKPVHFWAIRRARDVGDLEIPAVYMWPPATGRYSPPELPSHIPEPLRRAFISTADVLNTKNYTSTAVSARRTLEGIFKYLLPDEGRQTNLMNMIERATKELDLAAPLKSLSHAIRGGGNLGAHFDSEREPDAALARQMVELLEYLISYLYVLPNQIKALEESLGKEPQPADAPSEPREEPTRE